MRTKITILLIILSFSNLFGQVNENEILQRDNRGVPKYLKLKETKISDDLKSIKDFIKKQFKTDPETQFIRKNEPKIDKGFKAEKLQQYYKNIKVEHAILNVVSKNGKLKSLNGKFIPINSIDTNPSLSEKEALKHALDEIEAREYAWENEEKEKLIKRLKKSETATYYPKGELVIIEKNRYSDNPIPTLTYKFDVYATQPISRKNYYIDANSGEVIFSDAIIKHVEGIAATRYSGQRTVEADLVNGQFRLRDITRGSGITTFNNFNQTSHTNTNYVDNDNNWSAAEYNNANRDNSGLDAHWGTMMTYDYFLQNHNRNSIDDNGYELINYVNANLTGWGFANSDNAFWDGSVMTYGMGSTLDPLVSLDIIAHEIGHGLDENTSNLVYERESGAIDEGLSDIWGAMVEFFAAPEKDIYILGEDVGLMLRSMSNPKLRNDPDTYGGDFWQNPNCGTPSGSNDNCGVHTNSGILNHWFYLLAEGSSATDEINDNLDNFSINSIGKLAASRIIYRAQTTYFTPNTNYQDARALTIQAAEDLYGEGSIEAASTCQSWFAVGVGDNNCQLNAEITGNQNICGSTSTTYSLNYTPNNVNWSTSSNLQILSQNSASVTVKAINTSVNGNATITANIDGVNVQKNIWVGKPIIQIIKENYDPNYPIAYDVAIKDGDKQGLTSVLWQKISGQGTITQDAYFIYKAHIGGGTQEWHFDGKVTAYNSCGSTIKYFSESGGGNPPPGGSCITISKDGDNTVINPCVNAFNRINKDVSDISIQGIRVYNTNAKIVAESNSNRVNLTFLKKGIYIFHIMLSDDRIITKKILR